MNDVIVFTKLLKAQSLADLVALGPAAGLDGYDLCVRPGYPVNPDNALELLPAWVGALASAGLTVPMITARIDLTDPQQPEVAPLLAAMDRANVRLLKIGYFPFDPLTQDYWAEVGRARAALAGWEALSKPYQVKICYHTHSRGLLGLNCAALMHLLAGFDPAHLGAFIDPLHLVIEGEEFPLGAAMLQAYLSIASVKDALLHRVETDGHSAVAFEMVPSGTGLVDFDSVFATLQRLKFEGPLTVACEFEHAGPAEFTELLKREVAFAQGYKRRYLAPQTA